jgi:hypothetical protein
MSIDTRNKRASAILISLPWRGMQPNPDGTIGDADRAQSAYLYSGIASESAVEAFDQYVIRVRRGRR